MKLAIHHKTEGYSQEWINYCERNNIDHKIVDGYASDIIQQLSGCDALLWHHYHTDAKDILIAKKVLFSLEQAGIKVYPDFNTTWHFDDKVAQKYLLEAIAAPLVPSYVFYDKESALDWLWTTSFPKVFKLKGGSRASNVYLVKSKAEAERFVRKAFGKGFSPFNRMDYFKERWRQYRNGKDSIVGVFKGLARLVISTELEKYAPREKGYAYFQKFIPNNSFDVRIVVIGDKAIGERRMVRENDFRASGSGDFNYEGIDINAVKIAFEVTEKLQMQSVAFDFIFDEENQPLIVEISYGFGTKGISNAPGFWTKDLTFHQNVCRPEEWILKNVLRQLKAN